MKIIRSYCSLPLVSVLVFMASFSGYIGLRTAISNDLFGGDTVNVSSHDPSSFNVNPYNVNLPEMAKAILSGRDDTSPDNPHVFVYNKLSPNGRAALGRFVNDFHDKRSETEFLVDFDRTLIGSEVSWPAPFRGAPLEKGGSVKTQDLRGKNLLALAAVYPIVLPVDRVASAFKEQGIWGGLKALKPFALSGFTLTEPTRYTPLTTIYVIGMQSFLGGHPGQAIVGVVTTGFLYAMLAVTTFLLAEIVIGSIPWAIAATFFTMAATSTIAASVTLFSLPYLFVPIAMGMGLYAYLKFKKTGSLIWLLLFSICALSGPWFREFAAATPFIVLACEIILPSARRSWPVLILALIFIGHSVYPSFFTWLVGLNKGIVIGVFQQANTQAQMRAFSPGNLGLLFVQFPPSFWVLTVFAMLWWFWRRFSPVAKARFRLPFWDIGFALPFWSVLSLCLRVALSLLLIATVWGFIQALFMQKDDVSFSMISLDWTWALGIGFFVLMGLFSLRFSTLLPTYFAVTFVPFLWISLAEVHLAFTIPPLAIMLTAWVREMFQGLTEAGLRKAKIAVTVMLVVAIGDQLLNFAASLTAQKKLVETNQAVANWIVGHTLRNSIVLSNFYNYTDIYYYSGNYFDPFETVENNPLGPSKTIHHNEQMQSLLASNFKVRDIYFLQGDHDFYEWQRGYHSHKWVNNPPGNIRKLEEFPVRVYYYYLDPVKYFIPRNFVSFLGYMDWSTDYYFDNDATPFRRVIAVTYRIFKLEDVNPVALQKEAYPKFVQEPHLVKSSVGRLKNFNLVHFKDRFYAVPQGLEGVDWKSGKVDALKGVVTAASTEEVMTKLDQMKSEFVANPVLVKESVEGGAEKFNLIQFQDRFYAVPQSLGAIDWKSGKVNDLKGVIVASTSDEVMAKLAQIKPGFVSVPVLVKESIGDTEKFNLIHFQDRYYAVPQSLGAVDWVAGKVGELKGVVVAATPEEAMAKLAPGKPEFASEPVLMKESVGAEGKFNLIHFHDRYYAVPQALGSVDWESGKVDGLKGVVTAATSDEVMAKLAQGEPAFASEPVLLKESVGAEGKFNLIHFHNRYYAVPQALGSVDWESEKVDGLKGIVTAATPEELMAKLVQRKLVTLPAHEQAQ